MARKTKTKARTTLLKRRVQSVKETSSSTDLNEVAARLIQQSERNIVNQAAAHLIRKTS
jgi:hypothetical protein